MKQRIKIFSFALVIAGCLPAKANEQPGKPTVFALNVDQLERNKSKINAKDPFILPAYKQLIKDADKALQFGPVSVMEKKNAAPGGDKHDYVSLAPYHWPDPSKPGGLPYMRKDVLVAQPR